jgi:hypothetical protein
MYQPSQAFVLLFVIDRKFSFSPPVSHILHRVEFSTALSALLLPELGLNNFALLPVEDFSS